MNQENKRLGINRYGWAATAWLALVAVGLTACSRSAGPGKEAQGDAPATKHVRTIEQADFEAEVLKATGPVVVDFYADWCGPCKVLGPIMEDLAVDHGKDVKFVKVNVDNARELSEKYQIQSIPTLLFFKAGEVADKVVGLEQKEALRTRIKNLAEKS